MPPKKALTGSKLPSSIVTETNSTEPAKISRLIKNGYNGEKPLLTIKNPYEAPKKIKPAPIGTDNGKAVLMLLF